MMYWTRSGDLIIIVVPGAWAPASARCSAPWRCLVLEEVFSGITEYWQIILGPLLLLVVLFARGGIDGDRGLPAEVRMTDLLRVEDLAKRFGGIVATDDLKLDVAAGELHAVIGPNGAGKTTLIAQFTGQTAPESGRIHLPATISPPCRCIAQRARSGALVPDHVAVSRFQRARQCRAGRAGACRPFVPFLARCAARTRACAIRPAPRLRASASRARRYAGFRTQPRRTSPARNRDGAGDPPRMLLLDEPMAGMGPEESARMVTMLRELKSELTILLVEHDMEAVFALADRITVLVYGRVIATGKPEEIRAQCRSAATPISASRRPTMAEPVLALDSVETCYGLSQVLFGVSLAIAPGEMVTLMGRNGMGKTTTVRSIMGLTAARGRRRSGS